MDIHTCAFIHTIPSHIYEYIHTYIHSYIQQSSKDFFTSEVIADMFLSMATESHTSSLVGPANMSGTLEHSIWTGPISAKEEKC